MMRHHVWMRRVGLVLLCIQVSASFPVLAQSERRYKRSVAKYEIPDVTLLSQDRERVKFEGRDHGLGEAGAVGFHIWDLHHHLSRSFGRIL